MVKKFQIALVAFLSITMFLGVIQVTMASNPTPSWVRSIERRIDQIGETKDDHGKQYFSQSCELLTHYQHLADNSVQGYDAKLRGANRYFSDTLGLTNQQVCDIAEALNGNLE